MFARVSTYRADDADKLLEGFESVTEPLEQMDCFGICAFPRRSRQRQGNVDHGVGK